MAVALGGCLISHGLSYLIDNLTELELMTFRSLQSPEMYSAKETGMFSLFVCLTLYIFLSIFLQSDIILLECRKLNIGF